MPHTPHKTGYHPVLGKATSSCIHCGRIVGADPHGTLVDDTGGDVCGAYQTYTNEPHIAPKPPLHKRILAALLAPKTPNAHCRACGAPWGAGGLPPHANHYKVVLVPNRHRPCGGYCCNGVKGA